MFKIGKLSRPESLRIRFEVHERPRHRLVSFSQYCSHKYCKIEYAVFLCQDGFCPLAASFVRLARPTEYTMNTFARRCKRGTVMRRKLIALGCVGLLFAAAWLGRRGDAEPKPAEPWSEV